MKTKKKRRNTRSIANGPAQLYPALSGATARYRAERRIGIVVRRFVGHTDRFSILYCNAKKKHNLLSAQLCQIGEPKKTVGIQVTKKTRLL
jgi:hypothetical protein